MSRTPLDKLGAAAPGVAEGFRELRAGVFDGPLDKATVELVVVGSLASTGQLAALRVHIGRLLDLDVTPEAVRHALVAPLAAASTLDQTVAGLDVLEELLVHRAGA